MNKEKLFRRILEDHDLKVTKTRCTIFTLLDTHGLQSISELINHSSGAVDRVTVYRTLALFEQYGIVRRVAIGWKYKVELSEIFLDHHHHIVCVQCGRITALHENEALERTINTLAEESNFTGITHQLELQGYCPKCSKQQHNT